MKRFLNLLCYTILSTFNLALSTSQVRLDQLQNHKNKQKTINANRKKQIKNKSNDIKRVTCNSLNRKNNTGENIQDSIMIQKFKKMYPENDLLVQGLEVALISLAQNYSWDIKNKCYDLANKLKQEREKISSSPQKYYNDLMNQPEMVKAKENVSNILKSADPVKLITDVLKLTYKAHIKLDSAIEYGIKKQ